MTITRSWGFMSLESQNSGNNALFWFVQRMLRKSVNTCLPCKVMGLDTAAQTVDVQPMVMQVTPDYKPIEHGVIYAVPYGLQRGGSAVLDIPPAVGDIGLVAFASRDTSRVKATRKAAAPATTRSHSLQDGFYICTLWSDASPEHIISVSPDGGIDITSSKTVTINATSQFNGDVSVKGSVTATGDVSAGSISLQNHTHPVTDAPGTTGKPE